MNVCRTCGFTGCPGVLSGDCPRWPARDTHDTPVFGTLTNGELFILSHKLSSGGHAAHSVTETLAEAARLFDLESAANATLWQARARWCDLADECVDLAAECRELRAALAVRMTADA
jgi:hypothetical protein